MESRELQKAIGQEAREQRSKRFDVSLEELIKNNIKLGAAVVWWNRRRAENAKSKGIIQGHPLQVEETIRWVKQIVKNGKFNEDRIFSLMPPDQENYLVAEMFSDDYNRNYQASAQKEKPKEKEATA